MALFHVHIQGHIHVPTQDRIPDRIQGPTLCIQGRDPSHTLNQTMRRYQMNLLESLTQHKTH